MRKYAQLLQEYEELDKKYTELSACNAKLSYEYDRLQDQSDYMKKQDGEIRSLHQNVRQLKHDMKNHFLVIASCLSAEDYEQAKNYTSEIIDKLNTINSYVETGNTLMNHILNEKFQYAREQGILVKAEIENLAFASMKHMDFSALLTNMLDNAIEACNRENRIAKEINVVVTQKNGYEAICVKNRTSHSILEDNPKLCSTKPEPEQHGFGVSGIRSIADAYNGICDIYEEHGFFCISVFIPQ